MHSIIQFFLWHSFLSHRFFETSSELPQNSTFFAWAGCRAETESVIAQLHPPLSLERDILGVGWTIVFSSPLLPVKLHESLRRSTRRRRRRHKWKINFNTDVSIKSGLFNPTRRMATVASATTANNNQLCSFIKVSEWVRPNRCARSRSPEIESFASIISCSAHSCASGRLGNSFNIVVAKSHNLATNYFISAMKVRDIVMTPDDDFFFLILYKSTPANTELEDSIWKNWIQKWQATICFVSEKY